MSTKNVNQSQSSFDPTSMATFQGFQPLVSSNLQQFANDPLKSSFFNTQLAMGQQYNQNNFTTRNNAFLQNLQTGGNVGNLPAFAQSEMNRNMRGLSSANSNTFNNLLLGANQLRFGATNQMQNYRPLQTGQTQTQTQSGLGSWLPQLAGTALGAAGMFATGGMSGAMSGAFSGGSFPSLMASQAANNAFIQSDPNSSTYMPTGTWQ